jgi:hypothetical protein
MNLGKISRKLGAYRVGQISFRKISTGLHQLEMLIRNRLTSDSSGSGVLEIGIGEFWSGGERVLES